MLHPITCRSKPPPLFIPSLGTPNSCPAALPQQPLQVFRHHHEALEHLLHLAYYAMGMQPPALVKRVYSSAAAGLGAAKWRTAFKAADELPSNLQALALGEAASPLIRSEGSDAWRVDSAAPGAQPSVASSASKATDGAPSYNYNRWV